MWKEEIKTFWPVKQSVWSATLWKHTHMIKMTLTRFEACLLTCNEAFQHADLFLGLCLRACEFRGVCTCVGFVYWSIRRPGEGEETVTESCGNSDQIISLINVKSQDPAERSRLHADTTIILLPEGEIQRWKRKENVNNSVPLFSKC